MTPKRSCAPPQPTRKPVMTSSKISIVPYLVHRARHASRKPGCGGTTPMLPATGSTMSAAIFSPSTANSSVSVCTSLYSTSRVSAVVALVTPGLSGSASVSTPLPAAARNPSEWPW